MRIKERVTTSLVRFMAEIQKHQNWILMAIFSLLIYRPILQSPFGADDIWMSTLPARYDYGTESPIGHFQSQVSFWLDRGRLMWVGLVIETYIFELLPGRLEYKIYLLALNCLVAFFLFKTCLRFGLSKQSATLAFLIFLSLGQIRPFFDPRVHFAGLQQIVALSIMLITFLLSKYVENKRIIYPVQASVVLITSLLLYETVILFVPAWILLLYVAARKQKQTQRYLGILIFASSAMLFLGAAQIARERGSVSSHEVSVDLPEVWNTFKMQLFGTVPSSSFPGSSTDFWNGAFRSSSNGLVFWGVLAALFGMLMVASSNKNGVQENSGKVPIPVFVPPFPLAFALSALFLPVLLISITYRWQQELSPGLPYISVYLQQIGLAILVAIAFQKLFGRKNRMSYLLPQTLAVMLSIVVMAGNLNTLRGDGDFGNSPMIGQKSFGWDREAFRLGLNEPQFAKLLSEEIVVYPQQSWTTSDQISQWSGKRIKVINQADWWNGKAEPIDDLMNTPGIQLLVASGAAYSSTSAAIIDKNKAIFVESIGRYFAQSAYVVIVDSDGMSGLVEACFSNEEKFIKRIIPVLNLPVSGNPKTNSLVYIQSTDFFDPLSIATQGNCS